jgi:hypothetical protein
MKSKSRTLLNDVYKAKINYYNVVRLITLRVAVILVIGFLLLGVAYYTGAMSDVVVTLGEG